MIRSFKDKKGERRIRLETERLTDDDLAYTLRGINAVIRAAATSDSAGDEDVQQGIFRLLTLADDLLPNEIQLRVALQS